MQASRPKQIEEAAKLFESFERSFDDTWEVLHEHRIRDFNKAVAVLAAYSECHPPSSDQAVIRNLRMTYTRKFLEEMSPSFLGNLENLKIIADYLTIYCRMKSEIETITGEHPDLIQNCEKFDSLRKEFLELLDELQKTS